MNQGSAGRASAHGLAQVLEEFDAYLSRGIQTSQANFPLLKWMAEMSDGMTISAKAEGLPDIAAKVALELRNRYMRLS